MKTKLFLSCAVTVLYICGCEAHTTHNTYIIENPTYIAVNSAPPAEVAEDRGICPGDGYIWIQGHWEWSGNQWRRIHGHWEVRPHPGAVWTPGYWHYRRHHHQWEWIAGYWQ